MEYTWTLLSGEKINGTQNGNLLIVAENLTEDYHRLEIEIAQFISGARFQFNKADIVVETGMAG